MITIKKIAIACMLSVPLISNAAMEISIQSTVDKQKTLVLGESFDPEVELKIANMLSSLPNLKIIKNNKSCSDVSIDSSMAFYCVDIVKDSGVITSSLYEKSREKSLKRIKFSLSDFNSKNDSVAQMLSNKIYRSIFKKETVFNSKLAYVERKDISSKSKIFNLKISDYDGTDAKTLVASVQPILSIDWSPDNSKIAYVSYENVRSNIFIYDFKRSAKIKVTSFKGINAFPSWSPDGEKLAISLSKDGTSDIYSYNLISKSLKKITNFKYDATEPVWSSNKDLIFTANKTGQPSLYTLNIETKKYKQLSKDFNYTTSAKMSNSKGKVYSVYSKNGNSGILETVVFNGKEKVLIKDFFAESPSVGKGDEIVIYATKKDGKDILQAVDLNGTKIYEITSKNTSLKEPSYSN